MGHQDGEAAGARAHVESRCDGFGVHYPRRHALHQKLGEIGSWHDHALVDAEAEIPQPCFAGQVGGRQATGDALIEDIGQGQSFRWRQAGVEKGFEAVEGQMQRVQDEVDGLVVGVVGAMAEKQAGIVETADGPAQPVARR